MVFGKKFKKIKTGLDKKRKDRFGNVLVEKKIRVLSFETYSKEIVKCGF
jgi:hypothetical protein